MTVEVRQVKNKRELRKFIYLPAEIHYKHAYWIPPIYKDEFRYYNPKKNKAYSYCNTVLLLAYQNGKVAGRIMGIINHRYNNYSKERNARFGYLECWNNQETIHSLLKHVENWAKKKGMDKIVGPMGFNDQDPEGFLIEGFEHEPTLATYYNFKYMIRLLKMEGYAKEVDYVVYKIDVPKEIPDFYKKIFQRVLRRDKYTLKEFTKRKQLKPYIRPILSLMNDCFKPLYGFFPLDEKEMDDLAKRYLPLLDPRFIKLVTKNEEVTAFIISTPNFSEGIRKAKGHLSPLGIFKILRAAKKTKELDALLGAIKEEHRGRGLDVMLGLKTIESAQKAGFEYIDSHHILETNTVVRSEMERIGGQIYKRFRIFQKKL